MKKIYIPSNLDLSAILHESSQNEIDKYHYFIHLIYEQRVLYKTKDEYIPLKALYLRRTINERFEQYREKLIQHGIIACDKYYIKGKKSYGYKITEKYSSVKHKQVELRNLFILKNLEKWRIKRLPTTDVHVHLYKFLEKIDINYLPACTSICDIPINEYNCNKIAIDKFKNKDFYLYKDNFDRVHTNVTSLKSNLRKYLSYKNQELVNIDIVNSQPLILLLINPLYYTIRCAVSKNIENIEMDVFKYKSWVEQGILYEKLMEITGICSRKVLKEKVFRETFFGRGVSSLFWQLFPTIAKVLTEIKKKDYEAVAWMMQRAESNLMINTICRRIMLEHPEVFITTIHDSILTTPEHVDKVKAIIVEEFGNVGLLPAIRVEVDANPVSGYVESACV